MSLANLEKLITLIRKSLDDVAKKASDMINIVSQPSSPRPAFKLELNDTAKA